MNHAKKKVKTKETKKNDKHIYPHDDCSKKKRREKTQWRMRNIHKEEGICDEICGMIFTLLYFEFTPHLQLSVRKHKHQYSHTQKQSQIPLASSQPRLEGCVLEVKPKSHLRT